MKKSKPKITFLIVIFCGIFGLAKSSQAAEIQAASCNQADVNGTIIDANSGDTVMVPAGNCTWSSTLSITKSLIILGSGIDNTVITSTGGNSMISYVPTAPNLNEQFRLSGFTLDGNGRDVVGFYLGNTSTSVTLDNIRIDHLKIKNCNDIAMSFIGMVYGLVDNNIFSNNYIIADIRGRDNYSWANPIESGTSKFLYFEDNVIYETVDVVTNTGQGSRWAFRHNTIDNIYGQIMDVHGNLSYNANDCNLESNNRGNVGVEIYENVFLNNAETRLLDIRGGTNYIFNNSVMGRYSDCHVAILLREEDNNPGIGGCYPLKSNHPGYDPISAYLWGNSTNSNKTCLTQDDAVGGLDTEMVLAKQDFWSDTVAGGYSSSDYFSVGVFADRPANCSAQDCYWSSDTRQLFKCVGENTWSLQYVPYAYPHPLRNEGGTAFPAAPEGLSVS